MGSGIYAIYNRANGKQYIGSSAHIQKRWGAHLHLLERGTHHSVHLQRAWNKHGKEGFVFKRVLLCAPENLIFYEQLCIDGLPSEYNRYRVAGSPRGHRHSNKIREAFSVARRKACEAPEARAMRAKCSAERWGASGAQEHHARRIAAQWEDPEMREKRLEYIDREIAELREFVKGKPEYTPEAVAQRAVARAKELDALSWQRRCKSTSKTMVEMAGVKMPLRRWADALGIAYSSLHNRLKVGWPVEDALTLPPLQRSAYQLRGEPITGTALAKTLGLSRSAVYKYLKAGMTPDEIDVRYGREGAE